MDLVTIMLTEVYDLQANFYGLPGLASRASAAITDKSSCNGVFLSRYDGQISSAIMQVGPSPYSDPALSDAHALTIDRAYQTSQCWCAYTPSNERLASNKPFKC